MEVRMYVDADACSVVRIVEQLAKQYEVPCTLLCTEKNCGIFIEKWKDYQ